MTDQPPASPPTVEQLTERYAEAAGHFRYGHARRGDSGPRRDVALPGTGRRSRAVVVATDRSERWDCIADASRATGAAETSIKYALAHAGRCRGRYWYAVPVVWAWELEAMLAEIRPRVRAIVRGSGRKSLW